jgi:hypothetical protein
MIFEKTKIMLKNINKHEESCTGEKEPKKKNNNCEGPLNSYRPFS